MQRKLFPQATLVRLRVREEPALRLPEPRGLELLIYEKLFSLLSESVPRPDLVVYLQAPTEVLLKRVPHARPARGEPALARSTSREVNRAYNHYFFHYTATPLLVVNTARRRLRERSRRTSTTS